MQVGSSLDPWHNKLIPVDEQAYMVFHSVPKHTEQLWTARGLSATTPNLVALCLTQEL